MNLSSLCFCYCFLFLNIFCYYCFLYLIYFWSRLVNFLWFRLKLEFGCCSLLSCSVRILLITWVLTSSSTRFGRSVWCIVNRSTVRLCCLFHHWCKRCRRRSSSRDCVWLVLEERWIATCVCLSIRLSWEFRKCFGLSLSIRLACIYYSSCWKRRKGEKKGKTEEREGKKGEMSEISKHRCSTVRNLFLSWIPPHFVYIWIIYPQKGSIGKKKIMRSLDIFSIFYFQQGSNWGWKHGPQWGRSPNGGTSFKHENEPEGWVWVGWSTEPEGRGAWGEYQG